MQGNPEENMEKFDVFVSYYELTGDHYAEKTRTALKSYGVNAFVAHLERGKFAENFEKYVDKQIENCKYFILIITKNALKRPQIIREVKKAFPKGNIKKHDLWIFRENVEGIDRNDEDFEKKTKIQLAKRNQQDFRFDSELATKVLTLYDNRKSLHEISLKTNQNEESLLSTYDTFSLFAKRLVYDFENFNKNKDEGKKPIIETISKSNLFKYFIPQTIEYETRVKNIKTKKYVFIKKEESGLKFLSNWLETDSKLCVLLGDYGTGKTSLSLELAYTLAQKYLEHPENPIPVFVTTLSNNSFKDTNFQRDLNNL